MADLDKIKVRKTDTTYNIADAVARSAIDDINDVIPSGASSENKLVTSASHAFDLADKTDLTVIAPARTSTTYSDDDLATYNGKLLRYDGGVEPWAETTVAEELKYRQPITSFDSHDFSVVSSMGSGHDSQSVNLKKDTTPTFGSSNAVQSGGVFDALGLKVNTTDIGASNGVAGLDSSGKVPAAQLPSYVDDVLEYSSQSAFPATGETGKIYIALDTNKTYRWSGSAYVEISESLALGETSSTAYAGNKGKANADAIAAIKDGTSIDSFGDVESALAGKADAADLTLEIQTARGVEAVLADGIMAVDGKIGDITELDSDNKENVVSALNEVIEKTADLQNFSGSQTILDSSGNEILDSSNERILDVQVGASGIATTLNNMVSWFKNTLEHLVMDSGYTVTKELYEILNS